MEKFEFKGFEFRVILRDSEPWFVAKEVTDILGTSTRDIPKILDGDERATLPFATFVQLIGGEVDTSYNAFRASGVAVVNEPGLYSLIMRSKKDRAWEFKRWVTHEVLPTLRKTEGAYIEPESPAASRDPLELVEEALLVAKDERAKRQAAEEEIGRLNPRARGGLDAEGRAGGQPVWDLRHSLATAFGVPATAIYEPLRLAGVVEQTTGGQYRVRPAWTDILFNMENRVGDKVYPTGAPHVRPGKQDEFIRRATEAYAFRFGQH